MQEIFLRVDSNTPDSAYIKSTNRSTGTLSSGCTSTTTGSTGYRYGTIPKRVASKSKNAKKIEYKNLVKKMESCRTTRTTRTMNPEEHLPCVSRQFNINADSAR